MIICLAMLECGQAKMNVATRMWNVRMPLKALGSDYRSNLTTSRAHVAQNHAGPGSDREHLQSKDLDESFRSVKYLIHKLNSSY